MLDVNSLLKITHKEIQIQHILVDAFKCEVKSCQDFTVIFPQLFIQLRQGLRVDRQHMYSNGEIIAIRSLVSNEFTSFELILESKAS